MSSYKKSKPFYFKQFVIHQDKTAMKIGTDGVLLGAWANVSSAQNILDIGCGTGVIAIMVAQRNQDAQIHGVEIEENAFIQATQNMNLSPWSNQLSVYHSSIQGFTKITHQKYDVIISNPPFFLNGTTPLLQDRTNARHTCQLSQNDLLEAVQKLLTPNGYFYTIQPLIEGEMMIQLSSQYNFNCTRRVNVKSKKEKSVERLLLKFEHRSAPLSISELIIQYDKRNDYTEEYIKITKDYYLNM